jgi:hypothetical protein
MSSEMCARVICELQQEEIQDKPPLNRQTKRLLRKAANNLQHLHQHV